MSSTTEGDKLPTSKRCSYCGVIKPRAAFNRRTTAAGTRVLHSVCRSCGKAINRSRREFLKNTLDGV